MWKVDRWFVLPTMPKSTFKNALLKSFERTFIRDAIGVTFSLGDDVIPPIMVVVPIPTPLL